MNKASKKSSVNLSSLLVFVLLLIPLCMNVYWTVYVFGFFSVWIGVAYAIVNLLVLVKLVNMFFKGNPENPNRRLNSAFVVITMIALGFELWGSYMMFYVTLNFLSDGGPTNRINVPLPIILLQIFVVIPLLLTIYHSYLQSSFYSKDK